MTRRVITYVQLNTTVQFSLRNTATEELLLPAEIRHSLRPHLGLVH